MSDSLDTMGCLGISGQRCEYLIDIHDWALYLLRRNLLPAYRKLGLSLVELKHFDSPATGDLRNPTFKTVIFDDGEHGMRVLKDGDFHV